MVLGKLPVPGCPTSLDHSRARAYCACSRWGGGCLDILSLICHFFSSPGQSPGRAIVQPLASALALVSALAAVSALAKC